VKGFNAMVLSSDEITVIVIGVVCICVCGGD
jgi:hypothetical protein